MFNCKVNLEPISKIKAEIGIEPNGRVQKFLTQTCYNKMSQFVPGGASSELNKNVALKADSITYKSPYAHYQYRSILYVDPNTGSSWAKKGQKKIPTNKNLHHTIGTSYWDKKMWSSKGKEVIDEVQQFLDRG